MIECLICHHFFKALASHIVKTHKITIKEYREKFNFYDKLISEETIKNIKFVMTGKKHKKHRITSKTFDHLRGKHHSEEHKKYIRDWYETHDHPLLGTHLSNAARQNLVLKNTGKKHTDATKRKIARSGEKHHFFGKKFSYSHKNNLSLSQSKNWQEGKYKRYSSTKGDYFSIKMMKTYHFNSLWEKDTMIYLDNNPMITYWQYEPFRLEYVDEYGIKRHYIPDFLVIIDGTIKEIWEVKPLWTFRDHDKGFCRFYCKMESLGKLVNEGKIDQYQIISDNEIQIIRNKLQDLSKVI